MDSNQYTEVDQFRDKLEGTYIDEKEYLHRLEFLLGDIIQILETANIDDTSRKLVYSKMAQMRSGISEGCLYQFHTEYKKWCNNK